MQVRHGPPRPEHALVANDVLNALGPSASAIKRIVVDGIEVGEPRATALAVRAHYEKTNVPRLARVCLKLAGKLAKHGQAAADWIARKLLRLPSATLPKASFRDFQVLDKASVVAELNNGTQVATTVDIVRRSDSLKIGALGLASLSTSCIPLPIPGLGIPGLLVGASLAMRGVSRAKFQGDASLMLANKNLVTRSLALTVIDVVPIAAASFTGIVAATGARAYNEALLGENLADITPVVDTLKMGIDAMSSPGVRLTSVPDTGRDLSPPEASGRPVTAPPDTQVA